MSNAMSKAELIAAIAEKADTSKANAEKVLKALLGTIEEAMVDGKQITLVGFGTFYTAERKARTGRNPRTGKELKIPASKVVKFRVGKGLKESVK